MTNVTFPQLIQRGCGIDVHLKVVVATIDGVVSTTTHFVLKKYKEEGVIIEDEEADRRLLVTP